MNPQTLLIIAKELRQECSYIVSPVIKKRLRGWAARLEAEAKTKNQGSIPGTSSASGGTVEQ